MLMMRIWLTILAHMLAELCWASSSSAAPRGLSLLQARSRINQTIEELVATDDNGTDTFLLFRSLLEAAAFDRPLENVTVFLPLATPHNATLKFPVSRYIEEPDLVLHARDIVQTMVHSPVLRFLPLIFKNNITMQNGEEIQVNKEGNAITNITLESELPESQPARIVTPDIQLLNGVVVHVIDVLLLPRWYNSEVQKLALLDPTFMSTFSVSLEMSFRAAGEILFDVFTILEPLDSAWIALGSEYVEYYRDPDNLDELRVLVYSHLIPQVYPVINAQDGDVLISHTGREVTVKVDENNTVFFNNAMLSAQVPWLATNAIVYGIDQVLLPTSPSTSVPTQASPKNQTFILGSIPLTEPQSIASNNSTNDGPSGGLISGIGLVCVATILAVGLFFAEKKNNKDASRAVPVAAPLAPRCKVQHDQSTTVEPAVVEVLPAMVSHPEQHSTNAVVSSPHIEREVGPMYKDQVRNVAPIPREVVIPVSEVDNSNNVEFGGPEYKDQVRNVKVRAQNPTKTAMHQREDARIGRDNEV